MCSHVCWTWAWSHLYLITQKVLEIDMKSVPEYVFISQKECWYVKGVKNVTSGLDMLEKYLLLLRIKPHFLGHPAYDWCGILALVAME